MEPLSAGNRRVKRLARLCRQGSYRLAEDVFVVEGPVLVSDAARAGLRVDEVFVDAAALSRPDVDQALDRLDDRVQVFSLAHGLRGLVDTVTPNAMAAVVGRPVPTSSSVDPGDPGLMLVLCDVADPGNVGTLLRVAEAVGATGVLLAGASADPWSPKVVRASAGALFRMSVEVNGDVARSLAEIGNRGYRRIGTRPTAARRYNEVDLAGPVALILGSEAHGLGPHLDVELDEVVALPMAGRIESLNVAMTGAVLSFEAARQRGPDRTGP